MTRTALPLIALAFAMATPAVASAATDGTSNTIMFVESQYVPTFMDYTDDVCLRRAAKCAP